MDSVTGRYGVSYIVSYVYIFNVLIYIFKVRVKLAADDYFLNVQVLLSLIPPN